MKKIVKKRYQALWLLALLVLLVGCNTVPVEEQSAELRLLLGEIQAREQVLDKRQGLLTKRASLLAAIEIQQENAMPLDERPAQVGANASYLYPPQADLGQCYRLANLKPRLTTESQEVAVQDAADQIVVSPAVFETVPRQWVVDYKPSSAAPNVAMRTRDEVVTVRPSYIDFEADPALFETRPEEILATAAYTNFVPCAGNGTGTAPLLNTAVKWCPQPVEATYQTVEHREVLTLSRVREVTRPSETITLTIREPVDPADKALLEPVVKVVEQQQLVTPASFRREVLLPEFQTVTVRRLKRPAALRWVEVVCGEKAEAEILVEVQKSLSARGYKIGEVDGEWGENTDTALEKFREKNGLPQVGRDITVEELGQLDLRLPNTAK